MNDPGFERMLRHALQMELMLRLRHTLLHNLKGPSQTILSAVHLMQRKAREEEDLGRYLTWIREAAAELARRAEEILPQADESRVCDVRALTELALNLVREDAALKGVSFEFGGEAMPAYTPASPADLRLALLAVLFATLDEAPPESSPSLRLERLDGRIEWSVSVAGADKPGPEAFQPRFDVPPPRSGIAWHVARDIAQEHGGSLFVSEEADGRRWRAVMTLPLLSG